MSFAHPTTRTTPAETKLVICVWHPFTEWRPKPLLPESIRACYPEMRVLHLPGYDTLPQQLPDTHIFVGYSLRAEQLKHARALQWIHSTAAGVSQLMYPELQQSGVVVTNAGGIFSVPMAEHTMGLLLALARNFPDSVRYQDQAKWSVQDLWDKPQHLTEINGSVFADRRLWINRTRTGAASKRIQHARMGSNAVRPRRHNVRGENHPRDGIR